MDEVSLTRNEWIVLGVVAFLAIVVPSWFKAISNRRRMGYQAPQHGYGVLTVMMALLPVSASLLVFFVVSAYVLGNFMDQIPEKYYVPVVGLLGIVDLGVLIFSMNHFMPKGYIDHMQKTEKGMHSPLDWLVGLILAIVTFGGGAIQMGYVWGGGGQ